MKEIKINIWKKEEYEYESAFGFVPFLKGYLHETKDTRPCMIIVPGGGYVCTSPTEGEALAKKFYDLGFQVFVCIYTVNTLMNCPLKRQPLRDLAKTVKLIRDYSNKWNIDQGKIIVFGASAGGHLVGCLGTHFSDVGINNCRPDAMILAYPVVSTDSRLIHKNSFQSLLGENPTEEEMEYMSVEKNVQSDMPPCFIWHTVTDHEVSVLNSIVLAQICIEKNVMSAFHIFSEGDHGMALTDRMRDSKVNEGRYVLEQPKRIKREVEKGTITISKEQSVLLERVLALENQEQTIKTNKQVAKWMELVMEWLHSFLL